MLSESWELTRYGLAGLVFEFVVLSLACYRIQRIVTADSWYPTQAFRTYLDNKAESYHKKEKQNLWTELAELFSCPWCWGWWTTVAVFAEHHFLSFVPLGVYAVFAGSGIVGFLAMKEE